MNWARSHSSGYTIVETMVFLAVSGMMLLSAMLFLSGQQRKNEFATGVRDIQSQLSDIMNDVSTGFYNSNGDFSCTAPGNSGKPSIGVAVVEQGTNVGCTFVGKAIQFAPSETGDETAKLYTLVGRRQTGSPATDVRTLSEAEPIIVDQANADLKFPYGIKIKKLYYGAFNAGTVAFVTRFAGNAGSGGITGTQDINLIPLNATSLNETLPLGKGKVEGFLTSSTINPATGITLCFESGGTDQHADIIIGGSGRQVSTELKIGTGPC